MSLRTRRKPSQYVTARMIPLLDYYQEKVPSKYREHKIMVFLLLFATCAIAVFSFMKGKVDSLERKTNFWL